jgi:hypothetical protein
MLLPEPKKSRKKKEKKKKKKKKTRNRKREEDRDTTMQLLETIFKKILVMSKVVMTSWLLLHPITHVSGSCYTD